MKNSFIHAIRRVNGEISVFHVVLDNTVCKAGHMAECQVSHTPFKNRLLPRKLCTVQRVSLCETCLLHMTQVRERAGALIVIFKLTHNETGPTG